MTPATAPGNVERAAMAHFHSLTREQQADAVRRLAATGMSDFGISAATRLSVEQIRRVQAEREST
jgi:uncharacterized protein YoaH (UPF0181 family)